MLGLLFVCCLLSVVAALYTNRHLLVSFTQFQNVLFKQFQTVGRGVMAAHLAGWSVMAAHLAGWSVMAAHLAGWSVMAAHLAGWGVMAAHLAVFL
jgi:hypothetical protein